MTSVLKVLNRCLVVEFYRQNAGFFGLLFLILFGFIKAGEHIAIGSFLVANPTTLVFLYLAWIAYEIKVMLFVIPAIAKKENSFLSVFSLLASWRKIKSTIAISLALSLPIMAYATFLVAIAIPHQLYGAIASVLLTLTAIVGALSFILLRKLNEIPSEKSFISIRFLRKVARPQWLFFVEYLFRKDPVLLILSKVYSCLVVIGASALYSTDQFDLRVMTTGVLLSFVGNTSIIHQYNWFIYQKQKFAFNLPIPYGKFFYNQLLTFIILLFPEMVIVLRYYPLAPHIADITGILLFGFGISLLICSIQLLKQQELSEFIVRIFWLIVISTFLILFSIHPLILAFLYILIAMTIMYFWRFRFEYVEKAQ